MDSLSLRLYLSEVVYPPLPLTRGNFQLMRTILFAQCRFAELANAGEGMTPECHPSIHHPSQNTNASCARRLRGASQCVPEQVDRKLYIRSVFVRF
jgi:hypothetical protein